MADRKPLRTTSRPSQAKQQRSRNTRSGPVYRATSRRVSGRDEIPPSRYRRKRRYRFTFRFKIIVAALILIFVFVNVSRLSDYLSKKTDVRLTDEGITHAERFYDCAAIHGVDISVHQGESIKWKKVKTSGANFAFIRAGYRDADDGKLHIDSMFEENVDKAAQAGIMTGAYIYSQALTPQEAVEEADFLIDLVDDHEITMPLVIDYEIYPNGRLDKKIQTGSMYAASFYHDIVQAFCRRVEAAGYESAVYANKNMLTNYMQADLLDDTDTIWLAQYGETSDLDADYWFWQCSDSAKVGGISGKVDHDIWYIRPGTVYKTRASGSEKKRTISIGDCHVSFQRSVTKIKRLRAEPKLGITYEGRGLREGKDYVISVVNNVDPGTGYIIVRGIGKYKDWIMEPFETE